MARTKLADKPYKQRILDKIKIVDGHWIWQGNCDYDGYGLMRYYNKSARVGRVVLDLFKNIPIESIICACHIPECTVRKCVNPDHLYNGTVQDNMMDKSNRMFYERNKN